MTDHQMMPSSDLGQASPPFGSLDPVAAARIIAATSDVTMIIDRDGVIRDVSVSSPDLPPHSLDDLVARRWVDTVAIDSRRKIEEMLSDAAGQREARWREINLEATAGAIPIRFMAISAGAGGDVIAVGRDMRASSNLQQRLVKAQQDMERGYAHLRQAEARYRVLFHIGSEPVLVVDPAGKKVLEANPAAGRLLGTDASGLAGRSFLKLFHDDSRDAAASLLFESPSRMRSGPVPVILANGRRDCAASASLFRYDGGVHVLVSLTEQSAPSGLGADSSRGRLVRVLNHIPDAFVVTDDALNILEANLAFLDLTQLATADAAKGQSLNRFVGRQGVDLRVLMEELNEHGWIRNFGTVARTSYGNQEDVELSAVLVRDGLEILLGFVIRPARRAIVPPTLPPRELPRTAEQLTQLVGRVSLRAIVSETTDVIEQMCIEAALNLTGNNRVNAAEVLGLSRQSLYSKMKRFGLGGHEPGSTLDS